MYAVSTRWRLIVGHSQAGDDGLAGYSRPIFSALDLGCIGSRGRRSGWSASGTPTPWRLSCWLFGCFLGMRVGLVGIEHQTPLWRIERLSFAAPAQGRAAEASVTDVVNRPSRGQAAGSSALPSAAKRLGIALPSAAKCLGQEALLVAVEDQRPPADATCHIA
jgi:hypothetical protein